MYIRLKKILPGVLCQTNFGALKFCQIEGTLLKKYFTKCHICLVMFDYTVGTVTEPLTLCNVSLISLRDPRQLFLSKRRAGLQCSGVFMFVSTVDPGLQELQ
ncbi:hypothetical protein SFRURICE_006009 [Spodoptera frugiperda]|nr:hypothetical protein SFRURICE_006009 [Spodoptera frugiperda]